MRSEMQILRFYLGRQQLLSAPISVTHFALALTYFYFNELHPNLIRVLKFIVYKFDLLLTFDLENMATDVILKKFSTDSNYIGL